MEKVTGFFHIDQTYDRYQNNGRQNCIGKEMEKGSQEEKAQER